MSAWTFVGDSLLGHTSVGHKSLKNLEIHGLDCRTRVNSPLRSLAEQLTHLHLCGLVDDSKPVPTLHFALCIATTLPMLYVMILQWAMTHMSLHNHSYCWKGLQSPCTWSIWPLEKSDDGKRHCDHRQATSTSCFTAWAAQPRPSIPLHNLEKVAALLQKRIRCLDFLPGENHVIVGAVSSALTKTGPGRRWFQFRQLYQRRYVCAIWGLCRPADSFSENQSDSLV